MYIHKYRVDSSLTRVSSCLLSYEPPRYEIEVLREATLLLYDKTRRVLALSFLLGPRTQDPGPQDLACGLAPN